MTGVQTCALPIYLTGTFTYGSGDTKAELDEIIARSRELWCGGVS